MKNIKYGLCFSVCLLGMQSIFSQVYKSGEKVEAFINNTWKEVKIIKQVAGKKNTYEVQADKKTIEITNNNIRTVQTNNIKSIEKKNDINEATSKYANLHMGKYDLYSGIPTMYIGHIILLADGKYKVANGTDETNYEIGNYSFNSATNSIEWTNGLFKTKGWGGKMVAKSGNIFRIEFNSTTYAETSEN